MTAALSPLPQPRVACRIQRLVGGPGFEPGASRSRIRRQFIQTCRFLRFSVRFFMSTRPARPDLHESSAGLLHEVLQNAEEKRPRRVGAVLAYLRPSI